MRIPPLYRFPLWRVAFASMVIGGIISWGIFLFVYGELQEKQQRLLLMQQNEINQLEKAYHHLMEDKQRSNEEIRKTLTVQDIQIEIINHDELRLDSLAVHSLTTDIKGELQNLLNKSVSTVADHKELLCKAIENKIYKRDEFLYRFEVRTIYFDTTLNISLKIGRA
ncbi:sporulation membrane protein YtrI [Ectobacillus antri]|uniref:sporulation membrane protein YtrI n=1 Tax=Ectobacillus antri TaxID=2486280 RepID=UPI000F5954E8|nr:sporulation membrane protein YtrI [Ectobacillus antri]